VNLHYQCVRRGGKKKEEHCAASILSSRSSKAKKKIQQQLRRRKRREGRGRDGEILARLEACTEGKRKRKSDPLKKMRGTPPLRENPTSLSSRKGEGGHLPDLFTEPEKRGKKKSGRGALLVRGKSSFLLPAEKEKRLPFLPWGGGQKKRRMPQSTIFFSNGKGT